MAQIGGDSSGRQTNIELNLVPFIDLMSVCIIFLLVTAVWTQVSMIQLGSSIYAKQTDGITPPPPKIADVNLRVEIRSQGYSVLVGKDTHSIPKLGNAFDEARLMDFLKLVKDKYPDKNDAIISVEDAIAYEEAVRGMDVLLNTGFSEVSVATTGGE